MQKQSCAEAESRSETEWAPICSGVARQWDIYGDPDCTIDSLIREGPEHRQVIAVIQQQRRRDLLVTGTSRRWKAVVCNPGARSRPVCSSQRIMGHGRSFVQRLAHACRHYSLCACARSLTEARSGHAWARARTHAASALHACVLTHTRARKRAHTHTHTHTHTHIYIYIYIYIYI